MNKFSVYDLYLIPVFIAAFFSLKAFRLNWPSIYKKFSLFLCFVLLLELFAFAWKKYLHDTRFWHYSNNNIWLYNISLPLQYYFYMFFFNNVITSRLIKKSMKIIMLSFAIFSILNITLIQGIAQLNSYTLTYAGLFIIFAAGFYFVELINQTELIVLAKSPLFWIVCASFFFHLALLPFIVSFNSLGLSGSKWFFYLYSIVVISNFITYSLYSIAFLCPKPTQT